MIPNPFEQIQFPKRRSTHKASWVPVYIEPVVGSGERLCIGVVVEFNNILKKDVGITLFYLRERRPVYVLVLAAPLFQRRTWVRPAL